MAMKYFISLKTGARTSQKKNNGKKKKVKPEEVRVNEEIWKINDIVSPSVQTVTECLGVAQVSTCNEES